ncbi:cytochrome C oxidase subunit IV family protein [Aureibaculum conchae]|uniref:cytochrome C oxidase subunit IV family protein n=1 Tax=Aureibaculum sp. 2308TA14-22 TaxID=3108392 RepID=UPI003398BDC1
MEKKNIFTLGFLILLTLLTAFFSNNNSNLFYIATIILVLSTIKFLLVAFNFMELAKANIFWKVILGVFLAFFMIIISIVNFHQ